MVIDEVIYKISCAKNSTKNFKTISGALVLTPIRESFANKSFTSATVISRQSFNFTRSMTFEVKATLPQYEMLYGEILLIPEVGLSKWINKGVKHGIMSLVMNFRKAVKSGYLFGNKKNLYDFDYSPKYTEFSKFQLVYNQLARTAKVTWYQNGRAISDESSPGSYSVDITCEDDECWDLLEEGQFRIAFNLEVRSKLRGKELKKLIIGSRKWKCCSMIIDYIRVFDNFEINEFNSSNFNHENDKSASQICEMVPKYREKTDEDSIIQSSTIIIMSMAVLLVILVVALIILIVLMMKKKMRIPEVSEEIYDDIDGEKHYEEEHGYLNIYEPVHMYDQIQVYDQVKEQEYANIYLMMSNLKPKSFSKTESEYI